MAKAGEHRLKTNIRLQFMPKKLDIRQPMQESILIDMARGKQNIFQMDGINGWDLLETLFTTIMTWFSKTKRFNTTGRNIRKTTYQTY